jgi:adenylate kinase family enzyme
MNKITIVGSGGAGKSTLSVQLSEKLNIPVYHLDLYFWKSGWQEVEKEKCDNVNSELVNKDKWIIDGNFSRTMGLRMDKADTIIFLDIPRFCCLINAIKRYFRYHNKTRPDLAEGCFEKIDFQYYKWILDYPKKFKPRTLKNIEMYGKNKSVIVLKSKKEAANFLRDTRPPGAWQP